MEEFKIKKKTFLRKHPNFINLNLWNDPNNQLERLAWVIALVKDTDQWGVALHEVTSETYKLLHNALYSKYYFIQMFLEEKKPYGSIILVNRDYLDVVEPYCYDYSNTTMHRCIIGCDLKVKETGFRFHLLCTHLESLRENMSVRQGQIDILQKVLSSIRYKILLGDFSSQANEDYVFTGMTDAWINFGCPVIAKWTTDKKTRPDRIYMIIPWIQTGMDLYGSSNIPGQSYRPSDHYALSITYQQA